MKKRIMPMLLVFLFLSACGDEKVQEIATPPEESAPTHMASGKTDTTPKAQGVPAATPAKVSGTETKTPREVFPPSAGSPAQISGAATSTPSSKPVTSPPPHVPGASEEISGHATQVITIETPHALKKCAACHTFEKGGAKKMGPNLHGVYGAEAGKAPGFTYTDDFLKVFQGKTWDDQTLNAWLEDSKKMAPSSKMGIKLSDAQERAAIIQYLRGLR